MAAIRSTGTRSTEWRFRAFLVRQGIRGWRCQAGDLAGKPDFVFGEDKVAVFVDGCFWHGCPRCCRMPASNREYWTGKINRNVERDRRVSDELTASGWSVVRIWEHEIRENPVAALQKVLDIAPSSRRGLHT